MFNQSLDDGGFGGEVAVEIAHTHPCRAGQILHRCAVKAFVEKGLAHRCQNAGCADVSVAWGRRGQAYLHGMAGFHCE